jgi:Stress responsive A/B Barrel Domain
VYKRAYAIQIKPGVGQDTVAELIRVLEEAPQHIPGMTLSTVRAALPPSKYDLIWDNAFRHVDYYTNYLSHPYHCNVIDHFMYRESPAAVIGESLCLRWTELDSDLEPRPPADPETERLPTVGDHDGPLYLVEQIEVLPGKVGEYLQALTEDYVPMLSGFGIRQLSCLRTPAASGEDEIMLVWELADWQTFVNFRAFFQFENEPASTDLIARLSRLRSGGRRRLMLPATASCCQPPPT